VGAGQQDGSAAVKKRIGFYHTINNIVAAADYSNLGAPTGGFCRITRNGPPYLCKSRRFVGVAPGKGCPAASIFIRGRIVIPGVSAIGGGAVIRDFSTPHDKRAVVACQYSSPLKGVIARDYPPLLTIPLPGISLPVL
jgi:hypothetical protein